jgi:hypothetical protein
MSLLACKHCGMGWREAVMKPCAKAPNHEFADKEKGGNAP